MKNTYYELEKKNLLFNYNNKLKETINNYNKKKSSSTGYTPEFLFNFTEEIIFGKVKKNTIKKILYTYY